MKKTITLTEQQWDKYLAKFEMLLRTIAKNINGDVAIASHDDNYCDLQVAALESINGFYKKTGENFDEMIGNPLFTQYTKTCLWNCKNSKGSKIKKKYDITNAVSLRSPDGEPEIDIHDDSLRATCYTYDVETQLSKEEKRLLKLILNDEKAINKSGHVNVTRLAEVGKVSWHSANRAVNKISVIVDRCL